MKKILAALIAFLLLVLLAGCGAQTERMDIEVSGQETTTPKDQSDSGDAVSGADDSIELRDEITEMGDAGAYPGFTGVLVEDQFYHDGREEWITFYYAKVSAAQLEKLIEALDDYYDMGEDPETEIQLYTTEKNIDLKDYIGEQIFFDGEWFAANTIYHRRNIVFEVKEIYSADSPPVTS